MRLDRATGELRHDDGRRFDAALRRWQPAEATASGVAVDLLDAVRWLQKESGRPCRVPIGVIGPRAPRPGQAEIAERLGAGIAGLGLTLLCGGRQGVMEAVCKGVARAGGVSVGLLPEEHWESANPYVTIPLATGIGVARNAILARAALCLVAVGGGHGTLTEIGFALQFGRPVFALGDALRVEGVRALGSVEAALEAVARVVLALLEA